LELRHARASYLELPEDGYATLASVQRDLRHTQRLARGFGWHMIDATGKSVEEVAQEIVTLLPPPATAAP
jgi:regulator of PEP synthase PpsR (kinase-PPPase family)